MTGCGIYGADSQGGATFLFTISGKNDKTHFKRGFKALSGAADHEQPVSADLHPGVDPVHALQQSAVHVERQAGRGHAEGQPVPRSVTQTAHREPGETITMSAWEGFSLNILEGKSSYFCLQ